MNRFLIISGLLALLMACDPNINDGKAPEVESIQTDDDDLIVDPQEVVKFWVKAKDPDDRELTYRWEKQSGEFIGATTKDSVSWRAPLVGGSYWIRVKVSNADETVTKQETITVRSQLQPYIKLLNPASGVFLVQYQTIDIIAEAGHANGINRVEIYIDNSVNPVLILPGTSSSNVQTFTYSWIVNHNPGTAKIITKAIAGITGTMASDSVLVNIEGIIPGKRSDSAK